MRTSYLDNDRGKIRVGGGGGGGDGKGLISCFNRYGSSFVEQGCPSLEVKKVL